MVTLTPTNLHWIAGVDETRDLCAHSAVDFRIDDDILVSPADGDWTVSAAALYLLRTLTWPHTKEAPVTEHLFPCCGHAMFEADGTDDVLIIGCFLGMDFRVGHAAGHTVIDCPKGRQFAIPSRMWQEAVVKFSDAVRELYDQSAPKRPEDEDQAKGFQRFMAEWDRRREQAGAAIQ